MIKKLQQYILVNHPIIWNMKIVPMALLLVAVHIVLFALGYLITDSSINFEKSFTPSYYLLYAAAILAAILVFIMWLIQYNKNNGLKAYYPQTNIEVYVEWLLIFGICLAICFIPNSLSQGKTLKWEKAVSEKEYNRAKSVLEKAAVLLPGNVYNYTLNDKTQSPLLVGNAKVDRSKFYRNLYTYTEDDTTPNPIEYIGPSLLYNKGNYHNNSWEYSEDAVNKVYQWLVAEEKDSIENALNDFFELQKKHNMKSSLDLEYWMTNYYKPPLYPIDETILRSDYDVMNYRSDKYTQYDKLNRYYSILGENYSNEDDKDWATLVTLTIAMGFSVLVFSGRFTSGKSWIFALLSVGVLIFISGLATGLTALVISQGVYSLLSVPLFWLGIFGVIGFAIALKVANRNSKGKSNIYIHIGIWLIPTIIYQLFQIFLFVNEILNLSDNNFEYLSYIITLVNIIFVTIVMFPVAVLLRKWKALPED